MDQPMPPGSRPAPPLSIERQGHVAVLSFSRPPNNHLDRGLVIALAEALEGLDADAEVRVVVLAGAGRHFCAGADFSGGDSGGLDTPADQPGQTLYRQAARLLRTKKPVVAAIQGAAIGAGLGLAVLADFRIGCAEARFAANFTRLGFHPGFGLSATLPRLIGAQQASLLFYTGRRIDGARALQIGLIDELVAQEAVLPAAIALAGEIALSQPQAVQSVRATLRRGLADIFEQAIEREFEQQLWQRRMEDFAEGRRAMAERRAPDFQGR
ncbi:enoyl-CoA hydratase [Pseudoroseomonas deserti]|uniref:Enoyl-CoA hydratase n=1 Tax=Teichococcus deserti TaxID=1817963 RepID=A0A1V2H2B5_9PROT|nr:enoyl-CoA hydratase/isomerase family protein [Pseudoroseomonas deserti]ONG53258.1 enoyl-CoA hydratase [Pseudoroseomonas deserti]